jgi:hypothetical protein
MGNITAKNQTNNSKVLSEKDIKLLLDNTSFDREQILDWHSGFLVIKTSQPFFTIKILL